MDKKAFEEILTKVAGDLTQIALTNKYTAAIQFEHAVRIALKDELQKFPEMPTIDLSPPSQAFPDIAIGEYGIEVKFTTSNSWRCIGNSIQETQRVETVKFIYVVYGKMGGIPEVRWRDYEKSIIHVRTSHVPRFEVEVIPDNEGKPSLFDEMGIAYNDFRKLGIEDKMVFIRKYARKIHPDGRLWWIGEEHSIPAQARLYTHLTPEEKKRYRAEAAIVSPKIVGNSRQRNKYDDVVLYLLTYRGILCHQARDLFSAGSVANPKNSKRGGLYIKRALLLLEDEMLKIAPTLEDEVFIEYWGEKVRPEDRIKRWLQLADRYATNWKPSSVLFTKK